MSEVRRSNLEIDLALIGAGAITDFSADDCARLERARAEDAAFLERHPGPPAIRAARRWGRAPAILALAAASLLAFVALAPREESVRPKGGSAVTMYVKRGEMVEPYRGGALHAGDALLFRYSTDRRRMMLAGLETSGRASIYANVAIEPGEARLFDTAVELDDYLGAELVVALFSDEPLDESRVAEQLARAGIPEREGAEVQIQLELAVPADQAGWRITKEPPP